MEFRRVLFRSSPPRAGPASRSTSAAWSVRSRPQSRRHRKSRSTEWGGTDTVEPTCLRPPSAPGPRISGTERQASSVLSNAQMTAIITPNETRKAIPLELTLGVTFAVLGAALLHAAWNAIIKSGLDVQLDAALVALGSSLVALPFLPFVALPAPAAWPWLVASTVIHVGYFPALVGAY